MGKKSHSDKNKKTFCGRKMTDFYPVVGSEWVRRKTFQAVKKIKKLSGRINYMYDNGLYTDITFILGSNEVQLCHAHKFVLLASGSPIFSDLFLKHYDEICLPEINHQAFLSAIRFLYENEIFFSSVEEAIYIHRVSTMFSLERLLSKCNKYFALYEVKPAEAFLLLKLSEQFNMEALKRKCWFTICSKTDSLLSTVDCKVDFPTICSLLKMDYLEIESEYKLFCEIANSLTLSSCFDLMISSLLPYFRFLCMSKIQFQDIVAKYKNFLTAHETTSILHAITFQSTDGIPLWCNKRKRYFAPIGFLMSGNESHCIPKRARIGQEDGNSNMQIQGCSPDLLSVLIMLEENDIEICDVDTKKSLKPLNVRSVIEITCFHECALHGVVMKWKKENGYNGPRTLYYNLTVMYENYLLFQTLLKCIDTEEEVSLLLEIPLVLSSGIYSIEISLNNVRGFSFYKFASVIHSYDHLNVKVKDSNEFFISKVLYSVVMTEV